DSGGNLYIADAFNNRIRKVSNTGIITTVAGNGKGGYSGDGGLATSAQLHNPTGVAVDSGGNLYIADAFNKRIRKVSNTGTITTVAGDGVPSYSGDGGPATSARLSKPSGVAIDSGGNLYIADTAFYFSVRKVDRAGIITTVAGNGTMSALHGTTKVRDDAIAIDTAISSPNGVAVNAAGTMLYIADPAGIRKVQ
ncbi:MAG: hypothetical protein HY692_01460, partial [Cyanobacteria bacterium NC_groundwater_1444_Ag_S-0.65um_54_12]|nr:hypothetical protein [Cyanobacteria bacterium NC_groundwater_1444_Ag_S-0.65um_54_12]